MTTVPKTTSGTSWATKSNRVTTAKFPPPPRSAQNRSACEVSETSSTSPSAVTTWAPTKLSMASPKRRTIQPMPPPRVSPPTPTPAVSPAVRASPWGARVRATPPQRAPPPMPTRRDPGSTDTASIPPRSMSIPPWAVLSPAMECPPPRSVSTEASLRAIRTARATSSALRGRTTRSGEP